MTLATDSLLAIVVVALAVRLWRRRARQKSVAFWAVAFFATAIGAALGGAWHGFHAILSPAAADAVWMTTTLAIGVAGFALLAGAVHAGLAGTPRRILLGAAVVKLVAYFVWMSSHDDFRFVVIDYVTSMIGVALIVIARWRLDARAAVLILSGLAVSFAGAAIQRSGLAPAPWFNHNDLYHVVQIAAFVLLAAGGIRLRDREQAMTDDR